MHKTKQKINIIGIYFDRNKIYQIFCCINSVLIFGYILISYFTVQNIVERKQISQNIENARASIGNLESIYFSKMTILNESDIKKIGYVEPENISFAKIQVMNSVSLVDENGS